jgi:hypothetical protein
LIKGATRFTVAFDNHGDCIDRKAERAFFEFLKWWKPQRRIHGGDNWDFRALRRKASEDERREGLGQDLADGCDFLRRYQPTDFLLGNHDFRMWDLIGSDNKFLAGLASQVMVEIEEAIGKAAVLPYHKREGVLKVGHLKVVHGYHSGITAARQAGLVYGSCLMGHVHSIDQYSLAGLERRIARVCGCLCKLDMDYNRAQPQTLRQAHGWGYGLLFPSGSYQYWQAEEVDGKWYFPSEVRCA